MDESPGPHPARTVRPSRSRGNLPGVPVLLALLSALAASAYVVLQRDSNRAAPTGLPALRLASHLLRQPMWLFGQAVWLVAFALQALALHLGRLSVVQPVLVSELVFTLLIRRFVSRWRVRAGAWGAAALLCVSLGLFLVAAEPRGGHPVPTTSAWVWALVVIGCATSVAVLLARSGTPGRRAACYATAGALLGALEAALVKTATLTLSTGGLGALLRDWPVYALAASGAASGVLVQAALHAGPLTVSQPVLVVVNPLASIPLSIWLFGERFTNDSGTVLLGVVSFVGVVAGVVLLTMTGPRAPAVAPMTP